VPDYATSIEGVKAVILSPEYDGVSNDKFLAAEDPRSGINTVGGAVD